MWSNLSSLICSFTFVWVVFSFKNCEIIFHTQPIHLCTGLCFVLSLCCSIFNDRIPNSLRKFIMCFALACSFCALAAAFRDRQTRFSSSTSAYALLTVFSATALILYHSPFTLSIPFFNFFWFFSIFFCALYGAYILQSLKVPRHVERLDPRILF